MLNVIVECGMKIVNYLDITFNDDGTYHPCKKPNNEMKYIHADSDHPPSVSKQIPDRWQQDYLHYLHQKK